MAFYTSRTREHGASKGNPSETFQEAPDLHCSTADSASEILEALSLVHRQGIIHGHSPGDKTGIRFTKYHLLPTTSILVMKRQGEIVATCTLVLDSGLGLPMDRLQDLNMFRQNGARLVEVSCLALSERAAQEPEVAISLLMRYVFNFARHCLKANYVFASVTDVDMRAFGNIFHFSEIAVQSVSHGIRKVLAASDVNRYFGAIEKKSFRKRALSDFLASMQEQYFPPFNEARHYSGMQKTLLRYIFKTNPCDVLGRLTLNELAKVCDTFRGTSLEEDIIGLWPVTKAFLRKRSPRLASNLEGAIGGHLQSLSPVQICNVSETGLSGFLTDDICREPPAGPFELAVYTSAGKMRMQAEIVWIRGAQFGAKIVSSPGQWRNWLNTFSAQPKPGVSATA